jgi:hypothetical protein
MLHYTHVIAGEHSSMGYRGKRNNLKSRCRMHLACTVVVAKVTFVAQQLAYGDCGIIPTKHTRLSLFGFLVHIHVSVRISLLLSF